MTYIAWTLTLCINIASIHSPIFTFVRKEPNQRTSRKVMIGINAAL